MHPASPADSPSPSYMPSATQSVPLSKKNTGPRGLAHCFKMASIKKKTLLFTIYTHGFTQCNVSPCSFTMWPTPCVGRACRSMDGWNIDQWPIARTQAFDGTLPDHHTSHFGCFGTALLRMMHPHFFQHEAIVLPSAFCAPDLLTGNANAIGIHCAMMYLAREN